MRAASALLVSAVVLSVGGTSVSHAAAASHRIAPALFLSAESPSWSTDGKQIAFTQIRYTAGRYGPIAGRYRIARKSSKPGEAIRPLSGWEKGNLPWGSMQWVRGGRIVFSLNSSLLSVTTRGGKPVGVGFPVCRRRQCDPRGFILSPDRAVAAVTLTDAVPGNPGKIGLAKVDNGRPGLLATAFTAEEGSSFSDSVVAFSPDSRQLVFRRTQYDPDTGDYSGPSALMAVAIAGGEPVPLAQSGIPGAGLVPGDASVVEWSPDGSRIAYAENQSLEVVATAGGSAPRVVATCSGSGVPLAVSWEPTSGSIAFYCWSSDNGASQVGWVGLDALDGADVTNLLANHPLANVIPWTADGPQEGPQWSPDGSRLLILAHRFGHRAVHVWSVRPDGGALEQLG